MSRDKTTQPPSGGDVVARFPQPVILLDGQRRVMETNAAARAMFGARMVGGNLAFSIRHPHLLEAVDAVLGGESRRAVDFSLPGAVARDLRAEVVALPPEVSGGAAAMVILHDETAIRRVEQMRADFVANVSHELRSPLASVIGIIETLRGAARTDISARDRFLTMMDAEARRMARLIDDLLSLSAVEAREHVHPQSLVDIGPLLQVLAETLSAAEGRPVGSIRVTLDADLPQVVGAADELVQVFRNLMENALKYGGDGGVDITAVAVARIPDVGGLGVAVTVCDYGEGIDEEHIPRLTERFYRVDKGRSRSLGGTGLGLAIVKHIVNRHRGRLVIASKPGAGSTFTVYLRAFSAEVDPVLRFENATN